MQKGREDKHPIVSKILEMAYVIFSCPLSQANM